MRPRDLGENPGFLRSVADRLERAERAAIEVERDRRISPNRSELSETAERHACAFLVADPLLDLECGRVPGGRRLEVAGHGVQDPVDGRGKAFAPGKPHLPALLDALGRQPETRFQIDADQADGAEESGQAELASGVDLSRDPLCLAVFPVGALELTEHPGREARGDQRAGAADGRSAGPVRSEERSRVLTCRDVLAADMPVHAEGAAHAKAGLAGEGVAVVRG